MTLCGCRAGWHPIIITIINHTQTCTVLPTASSHHIVLLPPLLLTPRSLSLLLLLLSLLLLLLLLLLVLLLLLSAVKQQSADMKTGTAPQPPAFSAPRVSRASRFQKKASRTSQKKDGSFYSSYQEQQVLDRDARSLQHWNKTIAQWEKQEKRISKRTGVPPEQLNMQSYELFQQKKQVRHAVEEAIPGVEAGKGFRVGSEFWQPHASSKSTLHYTLTKTEAGKRPEVEFTGRPRRIQDEMKVGSATYRTRENNKDAYLQQRLHALAPQLDDLAKHKPDIASLEVVGQGARIMTEEEAFATATFTNGDKGLHEPLLQAEGASSNADHKQQQQHKLSLVSQSTRSGGGGAEDSDDNADGDDDDDHDGFVSQPPVLEFHIVDADASTPALDAPNALSSITPLDPVEGCRVLFSTTPGERRSQVLRLTNRGSTAVSFRWQKVQRDNALGRREDDTQRFFLDMEPGACSCLLVCLVGVRLLVSLSLCVRLFVGYKFARGVPAHSETKAR